MPPYTAVDRLRRMCAASRLFKARNGWEDAPVVLVHGGGPGSSGMFMPFSGAG